jgi:hypothetical protein
LMRLTPSGSLGIGTTLPTNLLSVNGTADFAGHVGIDNPSPDYPLHIGSLFNVTGQDPKIGFTTSDGFNYREWSVGVRAGDGFTTNAPFYDFVVRDETGGEDRLVIDYNTGNMAIGTVSAVSKLTVTGGDVNVTDIGSGVVMKSPDGNCWRLTVDNAGNPGFTLIACP